MVYPAHIKQRNLFFIPELSQKSDSTDGELMRGFVVGCYIFGKVGVIGDLGLILYAPIGSGCPPM